jgi:hypothetical protein
VNVTEDTTFTVYRDRKGVSHLPAEDEKLTVCGRALFGLKKVEHGPLDAAIWCVGCFGHQMHHGYAA